LEAIIVTRNLFSCIHALCRTARILSTHAVTYYRETILDSNTNVHLTGTSGVRTGASTANMRGGNGHTRPHAAYLRAPGHPSRTKTPAASITTAPLDPSEAAPRAHATSHAYLHTPAARKLIARDPAPSRSYRASEAIIHPACHRPTLHAHTYACHKGPTERAPRACARNYRSRLLMNGKRKRVSN